MDLFAYEGGWSTEALDQMQSKKICRCRADFGHLRHGHLDYSDLAVVIGPKANGKEWFDMWGMMRDKKLTSCMAS